MVTIQHYQIEQSLPDELPSDPMPLFKAWFDDAHARAIQPNPNAMTLATIDPDGAPSARIVLCKSLDESAGRFTFHTNRLSRKGRALQHDSRVALVFHWDALERQARIEGLTTLADDAESDAYFKTRGTENKLGAWASQQSEPLASREELLRRIADVMTRFGVNLDNFRTADIPRPPHWGGVHVWAQRVELWVGGPGRVHDRAEWTRSLTRDGDRYIGAPWTATRLQP